MELININRKTVYIVLIILVLLVSTTYAGKSGWIETNNIEATKNIKSLEKANPNEEIRVIVTLKQKATGDKINELKSKVGDFKINRKGWDKAYPTGFAITVTKQQMQVLRAHPDVAKVEVDKKVGVFLETASYWSGVTKARAPQPTGFNVTGDRDGLPYTYSPTDVVIAIIDTGIDTKHVDLTGSDNGGTEKIIGWFDVVNDISTPYDDNGHGTHVASIAAGEGDDNPRYTGVAPGAALVGVKVLNAEGYGWDSDIIEGINWVITNNGLYGIRIMSISLGSMGSSDGTDAISVAVNTASDNNILVTVAAGNSGSQKYTIGSPAAAEKALTVGAMADPGYLTVSLPSISGQITVPLPDTKTISPLGQQPNLDNGFYLAGFSSRGFTADNRIKPDVVAPGVAITAAKMEFTDSYHGGYISYSGTSMATPFVAGVAALILDANYSLSRFQLKTLIKNTSEDWGMSGEDIDYGKGRVRAFRAIDNATSLSGTDQWIPTHKRYSGVLNDTTWFKDYPIKITNDGIPFSSTLIMYDWSGSTPGIDLDLYYLDKYGNFVASSWGVSRQETITFAPDYKGQYNVSVWKYGGSGKYALDISYK